MTADAWDEPAKTCDTCGDILEAHECHYVPIAGTAGGRVWCVPCYNHRRRYGSRRSYADGRYAGDEGDDRYEAED